jgi:hypothetical protein
LQRFHRALLADREANIGQRLRGGEIEIRRIAALRGWSKLDTSELVLLSFNSPVSAEKP